MANGNVSGIIERIKKERAFYYVPYLMKEVYIEYFYMDLTKFSECRRCLEFKLLRITTSSAFYMVKQCDYLNVAFQSTVLFRPRLLPHCFSKIQ